ncbi:MAG TPA: SDR family oxidoreductase [Terriglobales bacterium]|nr:SDR family oxidoreductase [Terriglobales bacterium]
MRLKGRVAIITGAAAGIGRASAKLFSQEGAGVVAVDLDRKGAEALADEIASDAGKAIAIAADVSQQAGALEIVRRTSEQFGRVDILFNNAGIVPPGKIHETTETEWDRAMAINVKSVYLLCHEVVPLFLEQGGGVILNTASATALRSVPDRAAYSASKGAVITLTRSMALDYVKNNIRVNCLCPGTIDTPSLAQRLAAFADPAEARKQFIARQPMGRLGTAEEVAQAALYLVSDESGFVTGTAFSIDGGFTV